MPPRPHTCTCNMVCTGAAINLRLVEQACGCSTVRGGRLKVLACSCLPPALGWRVLATATTHLQCGLHRSQHQAPTDGASLRLLDSERRRRTQSTCVLVSASATCNVVIGAAIKLRLVEQACSSTTVRGGGGLKVHARVCLRHSDGGCLPPRPRTCTCNDCGLHRSRHQAPTGGASLRLLDVARRRRTQGTCSCVSLALGWRVLASRWDLVNGCTAVQLVW